MQTKENVSTEHRSIAGGQPLRYWLKFFIASLGVALGTAASLYTIFGLDFQKRMVPLIIMLILAISLISTLIRLSTDYRRRYRIERDNAMVRDLYPNRLRLQERYGQVIMNAERRVIILGISLHTLTNNQNFQKWMLQALTNKEQLNIHLAFQKPDSEIIRQKEKEENRQPGKISQDINANIREAMRVKNALGKEVGNRLHIHVLENFVPAIALR